MMHCPIVPACALQSNQMSAVAQAGCAFSEALAHCPCTLSSLSVKTQLMPEGLAQRPRSPRVSSNSPPTKFFLLPLGPYFLHIAKLTCVFFCPKCSSTTQGGIGGRRGSGRDVEELREAGPVEQEVGGRGKWRPFRASLEAGLNPARVMGVGMCM